MSFGCLRKAGEWAVAANVLERPQPSLRAKRELSAGLPRTRMARASSGKAEAAVGDLAFARAQNCLGRVPGRPLPSLTRVHGDL